MAKITDKQRLDWALQKTRFDCNYNNKDRHWSITAWITNGEAGNENGGGNLFYTVGRTQRDCIDKFIHGDIRCAH